MANTASETSTSGMVIAKSIPVKPSDFTVEAEGREIIAYASRFGVIDHDDEMVHKGAFAKSISERVAKGLVRYRSYHREVIGVLRHAAEDDEGLLTIGRVSKVRAGDEMLELIKDRAITTMSFIGKLIKGDTSRMADRVIKHLREIALFEVGPVDFAANEEAVILAVKSMIKSGSFKSDALLDQLATKSMWPLSGVIDASERVRSGLDSIVYHLQSSERLTDEEALRVMTMIYALLDEESAVRSGIEPLVGGSSTPASDAGDSATSSGNESGIDEEKVSALILALGGWARKIDNANQ